MKTTVVLPPMAGLLFAAAFFAGLLCAGCQKEDSKGGTPPKSSGNPATAPADYLGAAAKAHKSATAQVSANGLDKTIKLFYAQEGRYPKDLNELVRPDYLSAVPPPPAGMRYDYNPKDGAVKVVPFSVQGPK